MDSAGDQHLHIGEGVMLVWMETLEKYLWIGRYCNNILSGGGGEQSRISSLHTNFTLFEIIDLDSFLTDHNIYKRRLDLEGNPIEEAKKEEILTSSTTKENVVSIRKLDRIWVEPKF